jgi:MFS family permease
LQRVFKALSRPNLRTPILIFFFFNVSFTAFEVVLPLFTQRRYGYTSIENGYLFAYVGVLVVVMQGGVVGKVVKRWGETLPLRLGLFILTITIALIPVGSWLLLLLAVLFVLSIGEGITTPTSTAIISLSTGASEQGEVLGISQGVSSLARIIGPLIGGLFFQLEGETLPFIVAGLIMGIALILSLGLHVVSKPNAAAATVGAKH